MRETGWRSLSWAVDPAGSPTFEPERRVARFFTALSWKCHVAIVPDRTRAAAGHICLVKPLLVRNRPESPVRHGASFSLDGASAGGPA